MIRGKRTVRIMPMSSAPEKLTEAAGIYGHAEQSIP